MTLQSKIRDILSNHPAAKSVRVISSRNGELIAYFVPVSSRRPTINGQPRYVLPNGLAIITANKREALSQYREFFVDRDVLRYVTIRDGDTIFDIGANIGLFSLMTQFWRSTVYAFEPAIPSFQSLSVNVALYAHSVTPYNAGVGATDTRADFIYYPWSPAASGYHSHAARQRFISEAKNRAKAILNKLPSASEAERALAQRYLQQLSQLDFPLELTPSSLKTIFSIMRDNHIQTVDLLKIDVEGHELAVLNGIEESNWPRIKQLMLEIHESDVLPKATEILTAHHYHVTTDTTSSRGAGTYQLFAALPDQTYSVSTPTRSLVDTIKLHAPITSDELHQHLINAGLTVPITIFIVESLPRSDRRSSTTLNLDSQSLAMEHHHAETCKHLAEIATQVLHIPNIQIYDDILELAGGLTGLFQVISQIYQQFHIQLPLDFLYAGPYTIENIASIIDQLRLASLDNTSHDPRI